MTRTIESLGIDPAALERAWEEVCRRRRKRSARRQTVASAFLVVALAAGVLARLDNEPRPSELDVAAGGARDRVEFSSPGLEVIPADEGSVDNGSPTNTGDPAGRPSGPDGSVDSAGAPKTGPAPGTGAAGATKPAVERSRDNVIQVGCISDWCLTGRVTPTERDYVLALDLCVPVNGRTRRFSYATAQEVDFLIRPNSGGAAVWTWSLGQAFAPGDHNLDIRAGECVGWQVPWGATDETGAQVPAGDYLMEARTLAEQAAADAMTSYSFTITE